MKKSMQHCDKPKPPAHLSDAAKKWWRKITAEFLFDTPDSVMVLELVMECFDRQRAARELVDKEGPIILDRFGQKKQHPATIVERDAKMAMLRALRQLGLDVIAPGQIAKPLTR